MFVQAIHIDALKALSKIGVEFRPGQYVFNSNGDKGRVLCASDGHVSTCFNLKDFKRIYREYYAQKPVETFLIDNLTALS